MPVPPCVRTWHAVLMNTLRRSSVSGCSSVPSGSTPGGGGAGPEVPAALEQEGVDGRSEGSSVVGAEASLSQQDAQRSSMLQAHGGMAWGGMAIHVSLGHAIAGDC